MLKQYYQSYARKWFPGKAESLSNQTFLILGLVYLAAMTVIIYGLFSHWAYDDPFITYRYANNLAKGLGLVYNLGERVLSTTTPLFTLLLAALSPLWPDLPRLANLIGALALAIGGLFLWDLARSWGTPSAGWAGLLLYPTFPLLATTLGSETPLYLALCLGSFACYARQRFGWTATLAALAILARPDGALVPLVLGADYLLRVRRPIPWGAAFLFLGILLPWIVFAWLSFGSPLPATLAAKQQQGAMAISQRFAPGLLTVARDYAGHWPYWIEAGLAMLGALTISRSARRWTLLLAWTLVYFAAYSALGVSRYYWYYAPLVPGFISLVGLGTGSLSGWLLKVAPRTHQENLKPLAALLLVAALVLTQGKNLLEVRQHPDRRGVVYREVGMWLRSQTTPSDRVGTLEVGIIGYYAQRPMVDFAGLIQPEVAARLTEGTTYEDAALWAVERYHPDYLVLHDGVFPRLEEGFVAQNCRNVQRFPGKLYGYSVNLSVYACQI